MKICYLESKNMELESQLKNHLMEERTVEVNINNFNLGLNMCTVEDMQKRDVNVDTPCWTACYQISMEFDIFSKIFSVCKQPRNTAATDRNQKFSQSRYPNKLHSLVSPTR